VRGYHAVNLLIHILNALLVYLLVRLTLRTPALEGSALRERSGEVALLSGLLFVSHPVQTEAVTYVFQRFASLCAFFSLVSVTSYAGSRLTEKGAVRYLLYTLSLVSLLLAMKTKENAFTVPVVIALYEGLFFRGSGLRRALVLAPLLLTMLVVPLSLAGLDRPLDEVIGGLGGVSRGYSGLSRMDYLFTEFRVLATYIRLLFLPVNQNVDYDYTLFTSALSMPVLLSMAFILATLLFSGCLLFLSRNKDAALRLVSFGMLWFFITLSVESGVIPIFMLINEYRLYLPSAGAFVALGAGISLAAGVLGERRIRAALALIAAVIVLALSVATYERNAAWRSRISLWEDAAEKSPLKLRPHVNLGLAYYNAGMVDEAISEYRAALGLAPEEEKVHLNLALAYQRKGLTDMAIEHYFSSLRLNPSSVQALNNLGLAYYEKGLLEEAVRHYKKALRLDPDSAVLHLNLGRAYLKKGLLQDAEVEFREALRLRPGLKEAVDNLRAISGG
jgi:tetratricopeptide (TPR) repeat protein